jgi:hypothetical protein
MKILGFRQGKDLEKPIKPGGRSVLPGLGFQSSGGKIVTLGRILQAFYPLPIGLKYRIIRESPHVCLKSGT